MSLPRFVRGVTLAIALGASSPLAAQVNSLTGSAGTSRLSSPDGFGLPAVGVGYERALAPWLGLSVEAGLARRADTDPVGLILTGSDDWYDRTQAVGTLALVAYPVRFDAFGLRHRAGALAGPAARYKDERFHYAGFVGTLAPGSPPLTSGTVDRLNAEWRARGPGHDVVQFEYAGGVPERYEGALPEWFEPGLVNALVLRNREWDTGLAVGLAYEASRGRTIGGVRAQYRRYQDQRMVTGSHTLDLTVRVGYRF